MPEQTSYDQDPTLGGLLGPLPAPHEHRYRRTPAGDWKCTCGDTLNAALERRSTAGPVPCHVDRNTRVGEWGGH